MAVQAMNSLESLEQIAQGATQSPWTYLENTPLQVIVGEDICKITGRKSTLYLAQGGCGCCNYEEDGFVEAKDAKFCATFHPGQILKMIKELKAARAMRDSLSPMCTHMFDGSLWNPLIKQPIIDAYDEARKETESGK